MIDFVSTRAGIDPQTKGAAQLVAAIIAEAVRCACIPPSKAEVKTRHNINEDAHHAIVYLFGPGTLFAEHADHIGVPADRMRAALLDSNIKLKEGAEFTDFDRRTLQLRRRWWLADPNYVPPHVETPEESEF